MLKNQVTSNRRPTLLVLGVGLLAIIATARSVHADEPQRPNIILMMADDMGFSDIGCYGGEIRTPNLNGLADGGLRFTQFYNTARCCPTRASLMTGLYPHQAGVGHMMGDWGVPGYRGDLNQNCRTIAEVLREGAGYRTAMSGKWHVTRQVGHWDDTDLKSKHNWPVQRGYEEFFGTIHGAGSFYDPITLTRQNEPIEPYGEVFYYTDAISEHAAKFVQQFGPGEEPFFLYVAYTSPHWPLHALEEDISRYRGRYDAGWDELRRERHARMIEMGLVDQAWPMTDRDPRVPTWEEIDEKAWFARRMEVYSAQVDRMDQGIGRIVEAVRNVGELDNTLFLFVADNGGCAEELSAKSGGLHIPSETRHGDPVQRGNDPTVMPGAEETYQSYGIGWANASNTPFRLYKHWVHEGGISTPLIAHWPNGVKQRGDLTNQPGHLIDVMATCIDVAGADYPQVVGDHKIHPVEGQSLKPIFEGKQRAGHDAIFWEHEGNRAVRAGNWKLVSRFPGPWELYDLSADRTEMNNLAEKHPEKVAELTRTYDAWASRANVVPWDQRPR